jgi:hypothetical protein
MTSANDTDGEAIRRAGGWAVAVGAVGVVLTSVFYVLASDAASLPALEPPSDAMAATVTGAGWLRLAGTAGLPSDVILVAGSLMMAWGRRGPGAVLATAGWIAVAITCLVFLGVDAVGGFVLPPLAIDGNPAYLGFRQLYGALFAIGTLAFGVGGLCIVAAPEQLGAVPAAVRWAAAATSVVGVVASVGWFAGIDLSQPMGLSILAGALVFAPLGALSVAGTSTSSAAVRSVGV